LEVKRTDYKNKTVEHIKSKIIFINDEDIVDDVMHVNYVQGDLELKPKMNKLPISIGFTTFVDGLQYRFSKKLFTQFEKKAEEEDFDYITGQLRMILLKCLRVLS